MEPYRTLFPDLADRLPATELVAGRVVVLPTGTAVDASDIPVIAGLVRAVVGGA